MAQTAEELRLKLEADQKAAQDKLDRDKAEKQKAIDELAGKERDKAEKDAAAKKEKEESDAAKEVADKAARISGNPTSAALAEVAKAFRAQGDFNDRATAHAFANVATHLEGAADQLSRGSEPRHTK